MSFLSWKSGTQALAAHPWLRRGLLLLLVFLGIGMTLVPGHVLLKEGRQQERLAYQTDLQRVVEALQNEIQVLVELSGDWANWDDTYRFMADRNPAYIQANLGWNNLWNNPKVQLMVFLTPEGQVHWGGFRPKDLQTEADFPCLAANQRVGLLEYLGTPTLEGVHYGFTLTREGIVLLAARPILTSTSQGPSRGHLIMGRVLDARRLARIQERLKIPFSLTPDPPTGGSFQILASDRHNLKLRNLLADWRGRPALAVDLTWARVQYQQVLRAAIGLTLGLMVGLASMVVLGVSSHWLHTRTLRTQQSLLETQVTERTRELRESEQQLRAFTDHTSDLMFWVRPATPSLFLLEYANPAAAPFLTAPVVEARGGLLSEVVQTAFQPSLQRNLEAASQERRPLILEDTIPVDGVNRHFQSLFVPIQDDAQTVVRIVGSIREITTQREREEALVRAQKLESLGVLAGGIAHDFNNLLTAAGGNLEIIHTCLAETGDLEPAFQHVHQSLAKAADLTRQLLAYSGRGRFLIQTHDLNTAVRGMTALLEVSIGRRARLEYDLAPDLPPLIADGAQLQQVILNLILNASEALQDRSGTIHLSTRSLAATELQHEPLLVPPEHPGPFVALDVRDTGVGMPPEVLARVFEPFFSTKASGRGLGLPAVLGIVRGHQGGVAVASHPGQGTHFTLFFPAAPEATSHPKPEQADACPLVRGTVLLLEDEEAIRTATAHLLRRRGLTVFEAAHGLQGMEAFFLHRDTIQAVILDLVMPEMDGREFLKELRPLAPSLPVLITSGFTEQVLEGQERDDHLQFLGKPYSAEQLTAALAIMLTPPPEPPQP